MNTKKKNKWTRPGGFLVGEILGLIWTNSPFAYSAQLEYLKLRTKVTLFYSIHLSNFIVIASERQL